MILNDKIIKILMMTKHGRLGASSRLRSLQYVPFLKLNNIHVTIQSLLSSEMLLIRYQNGKYPFWRLLIAYFDRLMALSQCHQFDLIWIEKEALQWMPLWMEAAMLRSARYVLDYDDAVFHNYDQHPNILLRHLYGSRLNGLMRKAALVTCGNSYLARRANESGCSWVELLPTVIDLERYPQRREAAKSELSDPIRIAWIGSPATVQYLQLLHEPLRALAEQYFFVLRVIGADLTDFPGVQVEVVRWSENSEVDSLSDCDIGVMPLLDSCWERGKCGYKLIQYMACGLPVAASPVGMNGEIVEHGVNGFLAGTSQEWIQALQVLIKDAELRKRMGHAGRRKVEQKYSLQVTGPRLVTLLRKTAGRG